MFSAITWFSDIPSGFDELLYDLAIKATLILVFTLLVNVVLRRTSAAFRHAIYSLGLASLLFLPALSLALPSWRVTLPIAVATSTSSEVEAKPTTAADAESSLEPAQSTAAPGPATRPATPDSGPVQRPAEATEIRATPSNFSLLSITWIVGVCSVTIATILGLVRARRFRAASTEIVDPNWLKELDRLTSGSRLRHVDLLENPDALTPMMCGILRPAVIVPVRYQLKASADRRCILLHELAHVMRRDVAIHLLGRIVCSLYWFHPLAWWCLRRMQQEREYACDDRVLASGGVASDYANQLLSLARESFSGRKALPGTIGIIQHTSLEQRIRLLLSDKTNRTPIKGMLLVTAVVAFALFTTGIATIQPELAQAAELPTEEKGQSESEEQRSTDTTPNDEDVSAGVSVTCLDHQGLPVADAEVHFYQGRKSEKGKTEFMHYGPYKSDEHGKARCPVEVFRAADSTFDRFVYARVPGRLVGVTRSAKWTNRDIINPDFTVHLQPSQTLDGKVEVPAGFDPTTVEVRVQTLHVFTGEGEWDYKSFPRSHRFVGLDNALPDIFTRRPDSEGRFQFADVPVRGRLYLLADSKDLGQAQWWNGSQQFDAPAELSMKLEGRLSGQVLLPSGEPVRDIHVTARISDRNQGVAHLTTFRTVTDEKGKYRFEGLPAWSFVLSATDLGDNWVVRPVEGIGINSGRTTNRNLALEQGVELSGRVFDPDGKPVEGAAISAITDSQNGSGLSDDMTDEEGRYSMRLPAGPVRLYFNALPPEFTYPKPQIVKELEITRGQGDLENVDFTIPWKQKGNAEE